MGLLGIGTSLSCNGLATAPLVLAASEELKKEYLGRLAEAPLLASFCLTEPDAGSDVSGMKTTATRKGDKWVINGSKCFITNGEYANYYTVYAKTDKEAGHRGISCFIVPRDAGVVVDKHEDKMGQRASNTATITFTEVEIPLDHLVGEENKGFKIAMMTLDRTRPGVAAMATAWRARRWSWRSTYSKERVQFGVPIAMHQAIQFMIADMATKVHLSRLATWNSAVLLDQGKRNTLESSHAKRFAADSAMEVTTDAVQVYGGYGFIKEYKVEKLMRDAKILQLYEGTAQIQRLVIARETLLPAPRRGARSRLQQRRLEHRLTSNGRVRNAAPVAPAGANPPGRAPDRRPRARRRCRCRPRPLPRPSRRAGGPGRPRAARRGGSRRPGPRRRSAPSRRPRLLHVEDLGVDLRGVVDDDDDLGLGVEIGAGAVDELVELDACVDLPWRRSLSDRSEVTERRRSALAPRPRRRAPARPRRARRWLRAITSSRISSRSSSSTAGAVSRASSRSTSISASPRRRRRALRASSICRTSSSRSAIAAGAAVPGAPAAC